MYGASFIHYTHKCSMQARVHVRMQGDPGPGAGALLLGFDAEARVRLKEYILELVGVRDLAALDEALTHPSYANERNPGLAPDDGGRRFAGLTFLGDAVLGLCVSEALVAAHPTADTGSLTDKRKEVVSNQALARWARARGLGAALALGRGARAQHEQHEQKLRMQQQQHRNLEHQEEQQQREDRVLADAAEALVACVYEARGLEGARRLVKDIMREVRG